MSVRRLADDAIQPAAFAFTDANAEWAEKTVRKYPEGRQQSAVIPLLMRVQDQEGWVTKPALEYVADYLGMPLIRVLEVATFYTQFQLKPVGTRAHVQVCGTTPCMLRGAEDLKEICRNRIHPEPFHTNEDGTMSWEEVECLGACVNAPMVLIFDDTYEDLDPESFGKLLDAFEAGRGDEIVPGPQNGRHLSVPAGGLTSLTGDYDDVIEQQPKDTSGGPASGAAHQGAGAGKTVSTPPSNAGFPDTDARETDPAVSAPGKGENGNERASDTHPDNERSLSDELVEQGHRGDTGKTGGAREGGTDAAERDAAENDEVTADTPHADISDQGRRPKKEAVAEDRILQDIDQPDDLDGPQTRRKGGDVDLTGLDQKGVEELEGQRKQTSDTSSGPLHSDTFASDAGDRDDTTSGQAGKSDDLERGGEKPGNLVAAPQGVADDLKSIRGIGPVLETKLNELGVHHYRQIAAWNEAELAWVDAALDCKGRAVREDWTGQARALTSVQAQ